MPDTLQFELLDYRLEGDPARNITESYGSKDNTRVSRRPYRLELEVGGEGVWLNVTTSSGHEQCVMLEVDDGALKFTFAPDADADSVATVLLHEDRVTAYGSYDPPGREVTFQEDGSDL